MRVTTGRRRPVRLAVVLAAAFVACSESSGDPAASCDPLGGAWDVALDLGAGPPGQQRWDVAQSGCGLAITTDPCPTCGCGPGIGDAGAVGSAWQGGFDASWICVWDACRYSSGLEATTSGTTFAGRVTWFRGPHGAGYCPSAWGEYAVTGTRR